MISSSVSVAPSPRTAPLHEIAEALTESFDVVELHRWLRSQAWTAAARESMPTPEHDEPHGIRGAGRHRVEEVDLTGRLSGRQRLERGGALAHRGDEVLRLVGGRATRYPQVDALVRGAEGLHADALDAG